MAKRFYAVCTIDIVDEDGMPVHTIEDEVYPMELTSSSVDPITLNEMNRYELHYVFMNREDHYGHSHERPIPVDDLMEEDARFYRERNALRPDMSMLSTPWR